jgi:putative ABC transport system permease protein
MRDLQGEPAPNARQAFTWRRYLHFWRSRVDADVADELEFHRDMLIDDYRAKGMSPDAARAAAERRLGDLREHTDECVTIAERQERRATRALVADALRQDLRYALRTLAMRKTWTAVAVLTLALGIGANTAVFSVVDALILNPLSFIGADRLVLPWVQEAQSQWKMLPPTPVVTAWRSSARVAEAIESYQTGKINLVTTSDPVELQTAKIGTGMFRFAGMPLVLGRGFDTTETTLNGPSVVILGNTLWRTRFGASRDVLGQRITLGDKPYTIIGVASSRFRLPAIVQSETQILLPYIAANEGNAPASLVRLKPGVSLATAQADLDSIARRPDLQEGPRLHILLQRPRDLIGFRDTIYLFTAAVAALLLIACANVAHLMLARGASREREIAIRGALGASRLRIARQLITESLVLSVVGGTLGVGLAVGGLAWLEAARPIQLRLLDRAEMDWRVLLVALLLTAATGIAFGLVSAARGARDATADSLKDTATSGTMSRRHGRARSLLVVTEMALSALLLVGATLVVRSIVKLQAVDPGFDSKHLYAIDVRLPQAGYKTGGAVAPVMDALAARARQLPGVSNVTVASSMPPNIMIMVVPLEIETRTGPRVDEGSSFNPQLSVRDDFFSKAGIRFVEGGTFAPHAADRREVIINASLARRLWPGESALGHHLRMAYSNPKDREPWNTVVGVTTDLMVHGLSGVGKEGLIIYPDEGLGRTLAVRTTDAAAVFRELRAAARRIDPAITTLNMTSVETAVTDTIAEQRFITLLLSGFAVLAVALSAIGLYGVLSYSVAERTREIGVRIALGATPSNLAAEVVRGGIVLSTIGLVIGLVAANWGTRLLRSVLFSVGEHDAPSYLAAGALLLGVSIIACVIPMRRAMAVDPVIAMRDGADRRW